MASVERLANPELRSIVNTLSVDELPNSRSSS